MEEPSLPEKLIENGTTSVAVGAAAFALSAADPAFGSLVGGIITLLTNSLGAMSFQARLKETLQLLSDDQQAMKDKISSMSGAQFKLAAESFQTLIRTSEHEKLEFLRNVIRGTVERADLKETDASILSLEIALCPSTL